MRSAGPVSSAARKSATGIAAGLFAGLGLQVGVWAVLIPHVVASRDLTPAALGAALALMAATSIGALAVAGPLADRVGRRPVAVAGAAGFAAAFVLLAAVEAQAALWPTVALYGVASGFLDLAANAVGSDYERAYRVRAMIRLHAGFSAAAAAGALLAGAVGPDDLLDRGGDLRRPRGRDDDRAAAAARARPSTSRPAGASRCCGSRRSRSPSRCARCASSATARSRATPRCSCATCWPPARCSPASRSPRSTARRWSGGCCSGASRDERLRADRSPACWRAPGWRSSSRPARRSLAAAGLLIVGFALSPVVPTALSLAGRSAPGRSATAVSLVTTIGYGAFVAGPPLVGALAGLTSLRAALVPVVASTAAIALLARRLPRPR